jgi:hypothetical protein
MIFGVFYHKSDEGGGAAPAANFQTVYSQIQSGAENISKLITHSGRKRDFLALKAKIDGFASANPSLRDALAPIAKKIGEVLAKEPPITPGDADSVLKLVRESASGFMAQEPKGQEGAKKTVKAPANLGKIGKNAKKGRKIVEGALQNDGDGRSQQREMLSHQLGMLDAGKKEVFFSKIGEHGELADPYRLAFLAEMCVNLDAGEFEAQADACASSMWLLSKREDEWLGAGFDKEAKRALGSMDGARQAVFYDMLRQAAGFGILAPQIASMEQLSGLVRGFAEIPNYGAHMLLGEHILNRLLKWREMKSMLELDGMDSKKYEFYGFLGRLAEKKAGEMSIVNAGNLIISSIREASGLLRDFKNGSSQENSSRSFGLDSSQRADAPAVQLIKELFPGRAGDGAADFFIALKPKGKLHFPTHMLEREGYGNKVGEFCNILSEAIEKMGGIEKASGKITGVDLREFLWLYSNGALTSDYAVYLLDKKKG